MRFEWDERKRLANLVKHGLDFRRATDVFAGSCVSYPSPRQNEDRWVTVGTGHGRLVAIVWTRRSDAVRVISMRRARREEERQYRELLRRRIEGDGGTR
jgi:uncharacterized DUF497 family protein